MTSEFYESLISSAKGLVTGERDYIVNTANIASLVYHQLNLREAKKNCNNVKVNWVGFYFSRPKTLNNQGQEGHVAASDPHHDSHAAVHLQEVEQQPQQQQQRELVLGPFHGLPACRRIAFGRGVCGTAALKRQSLLVPDVHAFPGHIACDSASESEIVVPIIINNNKEGDNSIVVGVFDIDSPNLRGLNEEDQAAFEAIANVIATSCDWTPLLL